MFIIIILFIILIIEIVAIEVRMKRKMKNDKLMLDRLHITRILKSRLF